MLYQDIVRIWDPYERLLWGIALTIAVMCGIYFIHIARKREVFNERIIMLGLTGLIFGFTFSLFFTFIQVLQIPVNLIDNAFVGAYEYAYPAYEFFGRLSYISLGIGGMFFVIAFEIIIKRVKFLFTIIFLIIIILIAISGPFKITRNVFNYILLIGLVIIVPLILFLYTKWSHLEFKAVSSFLLLGFLLFMNSLLLAHKAHKELNAFPLFLSPFIFIIGCCIIIMPIFLNPKSVSRPLIYWILFAIFAFPIFIFMITVDLVIGIPTDFNPLFTFEIIFAFLYVSIIFIFIIKNIRTEMDPARQEARKGDEDFLAMFTRPQQVSFLASMSHELRTPLTSIIGFTSTILNGRAGDINEEQEKQLKIILSSANHLHELINDVLDITKIEVKKLEIRKESFDLVAIISKLKETFNLVIMEKGLEFIINAPEILTIYDDKKRINQILINLIGNAIKFTEKGKVVIKVKKKNENVEISVKDTGPGIREKDIKTLFKPFSQIIDLERSKEGSGLGLYLSKNLANLLGGDITVKSKFGRGSTFKLILELKEEEIPY